MLSQRFIHCQTLSFVSWPPHGLNLADNAKDTAKGNDEGAMLMLKAKLKLTKGN